MVEARYEQFKPSPEENDTETENFSDFDMAWLPVISTDSRDVIDEIIYVGKATMKKMWLEE